MLSLVSAVTEHDGEAKAEAWARNVVGNFARKPVGGDTDQIKAVASGECGIALTNTYYWVRMLKSTKPDEQELVKKVGCAAAKYVYMNMKNLLATFATRIHQRFKTH